MEHEPAGTSAAAAAGQGLFAGRSAVYAVMLAGGVGLHAVNMNIVATIMPSVVADIGGLDLYAWATTLFVVASILAAALTADLLKRLGPRGAYAVAIGLFAGGTLVASLAPGMGVMLAGRLVQGFGGGFFYALAYAVTRIVFPPALWPRAIGLIAATFGIATLIGPAVGGVFAQQVGWRAAFWSLLPVAAAFLALALVSLPGRSRDAAGNAAVPWLQLALVSAAVLSVSAGSLSQDLRWNLAGLAVAIGSIVAIALVERRSAARMLPRGAFSLHAPIGIVYLTIIMLMTSLQPEVFAPYLLQTLHDQSPLAAGYLTALVSIGWTAGTLASGRIRIGRARLITGGPAIVLVGLVLIALFMPVPSGGRWLVVAPVALGLTLVGFGIGAAWPSLVTLVYRTAPPDEQDRASGGMTTVQLFAFAFGTALAGMVANIAGIAEPGGVAGARSAALWTGALFTLAPALAIALALRINRLVAD